MNLEFIVVVSQLALLSLATYVMFLERRVRRNEHTIYHMLTVIKTMVVEPAIEKAKVDVEDFLGMTDQEIIDLLMEDE